MTLHVDSCYTKCETVGKLVFFPGLLSFQRVPTVFSPTTPRQIPRNSQGGSMMEGMDPPETEMGETGKSEIYDPSTELSQSTEARSTM
jgi:hypothetical protein